MIFNFDPSKRHNIYSWLDAQLDAHDRPRNVSCYAPNTTTHTVTRKQLFIIVEDFFFNLAWDPKTSRYHTADDLNSFSFPIVFCEEFMNKYTTLVISFEDVFDAFLNVRRVHPQYKADYNISANDSPNEIKYMKAFASFMNRYIDNNLLNFPFEENEDDMCNYFKTSFLNRVDEFPDSSIHDMIELWYQQFINPDVDIDTVVNLFNMSQFTEQFQFCKHFTEQYENGIVTTDNYREPETLQQIQQSFKTYLLSIEWSNEDDALEKVPDMYLFACHVVFKPFIECLNTNVTITTPKLNALTTENND